MIFCFSLSCGFEKLLGLFLSGIVNNLWLLLEIDCRVELHAVEFRCNFIGYIDITFVGRV